MAMNTYGFATKNEQEAFIKGIEAAGSKEVYVVDSYIDREYNDGEDTHVVDINVPDD